MKPKQKEKLVLKERLEKDRDNETMDKSLKQVLETWVRIYGRNLKKI